MAEKRRKHKQEKWHRENKDCSIKKEKEGEFRNKGTRPLVGGNT
jgi:hypothetical protein